ncbi:DUF461 domain-containing protein [Streptomyces sp. NPDC127106]|uniref:DUF461 domain-containing protein n=1 Tax=Streptomyces sp. NPDC127106 TaxID=3345360 RepID=UPI00363836E6
MSRSLRRGALAATAVVFSIASLAACGAGNDAQTLQIKPDNASAVKGEIEIQNALVITQGTKERRGGAVVSATLFNNSMKPEILESISLPGRGKVLLKPAEGTGKVVVPSGGSVVIGGKGNATAVIEGPSEAVKNGAAQELVFKMSSTGDIPLEAFVVPNTGAFAPFGPTEAPAAGPNASGSPAAAPSGSPAAAPSGSPAATPSGAASGSPAAGASAGASTSPSPSASASRSAGH